MKYFQNTFCKLCEIPTNQE